MDTYETLNIELLKSQAIVTKKENELFDYVLGLLKPKFPHISKVHISYRGIIIYVTNDDSNFDHEIKINNDADWDTKDTFTPKLSWFSTQVKRDDITILNYLEVLGFIATEMRYFDSVLFKIFSDCVITLGELERNVNSIHTKISKLAVDKAKAEEDTKRLEFNSEFKDGNYYVSTYVGRSSTTHKIVKIIKINPKTVTIMRTENFRSYTIQSLETNNFDYNRVKGEELYSEIKNYKLVSWDEIKEMAEYQRKEIES